MEKAIQKLANIFGYRISKLERPRTFDAFGAMQSLVNKGDELIIFDVGAHHGLISGIFRDRFPASTVYAFEPFAESYAKLKENTASDERVKVFSFGFSDQDCTQAFHSNTSSETNSLLSTAESGSNTWRRGLLDTKNIVQAQFRTVDSFVEEMNIPRIDILKLDVQGAEQLVISGATETCQRGMIGLIYSEVITQPTYNGQKRFDQALASFYNANFDLYNIYNMSYTREGRLRQVDAIFTKIDK